MLEDPDYRIRTYGYDDLNRLTKAEKSPHPNGGYAIFHYEYDPIGNMTRQWVEDTWYNPISDEYMRYGEDNGSPRRPGPHALTSMGTNIYRYDENGNMLSAPNKLMMYDVENRLISVETSTDTTTFTYDADGSRIKKSSLRTAEGGEAISTTYISSLYEKDHDGKIRKHIFAGANRVCTVSLSPEGGEGQGEGKTVAYYHGDHLGSSNIITDATGAQVQYCEYTPYGTFARNELSNGQTTQATNRYFTGKELDSTGLYFYAWRYYDPTIGRYCQPDTIIPEPYNPQTLNRYSYCDNNPLNYTDPSGHFKLGKWLGKIFGAIAGVITTVATGNPVLGFQVYSAISSVYDTGYALAHGADPLRTIGAFIAANVLAAVLPGGGTYDNIFLQVGIHAARGAVIGATTAAIAGSDIGEGALWGGVVGGAVGFASSNQVQNFMGGKGFVSNAQLQKINIAKTVGNLENVADTQRGLAYAERVAEGAPDVFRISAMERVHNGVKNALNTTKNFILNRTLKLEIQAEILPNTTVTLYGGVRLDSTSGLVIESPKMSLTPGPKNHIISSIEEIITNIVTTGVQLGNVPVTVE